jgi:hypothetical protein
MDPPVFQFAPTRLGSDRGSVSLAFDRFPDIGPGATFPDVKLVARAVSALGDIRRISQSYDCSIEWCHFTKRVLIASVAALFARFANTPFAM